MTTCSASDPSLPHRLTDCTAGAARALPDDTLTMMYLDPDRIVQQRAVHAESVTWQVAIHASPPATPELHPPFEVAVTETGYDGHRRVIDARYAVDLPDAVRWANTFLADPNIIPARDRSGTPAFVPPPTPDIATEDTGPAAALSEVLFA